VFPTVYLIFTCCYLWFYCASANIELADSEKNFRYAVVNWFSGISFEFYLFHSLILDRISKSIGGHTAWGQYMKLIFVTALITTVFSIGYHKIFLRNK
jgi:peptidoglycan/LPS O-acetylase OafA/YrhL